jgi:hypothetical protein
VLEGDRLILVPVTGTESNWFRNVEKTPSIGLKADGAEVRVEAQPTVDPTVVDYAARVFGEKYGADRVKEYYPNLNAAVEVSLA